MSIVPFVKSTRSSGEKASKIPVTAYLLDNLWLWAILIFVIAMVYGVWAMIESSVMHIPSGMTPR
ncbi:hypothetical protein ATG_08220 [Desulfurococcaceae archaeon AG1]|nr:MAG: hypothetical protein DJ555_04180 [Desulfurococcaceae archaeon]GAY25619.1 hypothetical protein ATG_08220 [Desulfurococcaceae archaeon AG1]